MAKGRVGFVEEWTNFFFSFFLFSLPTRLGEKERSFSLLHWYWDKLSEFVLGFCFVNLDSSFSSLVISVDPRRN